MNDNDKSEPATKADMQKLATKADLQKLKQATKADMQALEQKLNGKIDSVEQKLTGRIDSVETTVKNIAIELTKTQADVRGEGKGSVYLFPRPCPWDRRRYHCQHIAW